MTQRLVIQNGTVITGDKELGTFPRADILVEGSLKTARSLQETKNLAPFLVLISS